MRNAFLVATISICGATSAFAEQATVDSYTPRQEERAKAAIVNAGYRPDKLTMVQDGNFFFTATKNGKSYQATVTSAGKVYVSTSLPMRGTDRPPAG